MQLKISQKKKSMIADPVYLKMWSKLFWCYQINFDLEDKFQNELIKIVEMCADKIRYNSEMCSIIVSWFMEDLLKSFES